MRIVLFSPLLLLLPTLISLSSRKLTHADARAAVFDDAADEHIQKLEYALEGADRLRIRLFTRNGHPPKVVHKFDMRRETGGDFSGKPLCRRA